MSEIVDLYDKNKKLTGKTAIRGSQFEKGLYRLSVHIWITNSKRKIYIQKRASSRKIFPDLWENPGGGAISGDASKDTLIKEFKEELGIDPNINKAIHFKTVKRKSDFVDMWHITQDFKIKQLILQKEEVSEAKWVSFKEIEKMISKGLFVPTFNESYIPFIEYFKK